ncbi:MAG: PEP-CTERM sorting domain-containing protein, partial [Oleiphilaceae bacterium]|nr:PEP-CTERM sorting domain-containing protein [Oleiphilaceae bacterium]
MKKLFLILALCTCTTANAALITYSYDHTISNRYEMHDALGLFTVDDQREGLVSVLFASQPATFSWEGYAPLMYDEVVATESQLYENGFESFTANNVTFDLWLDLFWLDAGENIFHHLDKAAPYEGALLAVDGNPYWLGGSLNKVRTVEVPEPSALALLSLGLLGFALK